MVRAGDLADRAMYFRNDLAYIASAGAIPKNPHTFLTNIGSVASAPYAVTIEPDTGGGFFEMPIVPRLPEGLNFLP